MEGWGDDQKCVEAVAAYLVGLLASSVSHALTVCAQLENTQGDQLELLHSVQAITGTPAQPLTVDQKQDERNPWIAEGLWHLCLFIAAQKTDLHPIGQIIALDFPHVGAKDHGFDVVAMYSCDVGFGLSFVESKAYEHYPNKAINDAVEFFRGLDTGDYNVRARQLVAAMRGALPVAQQNLVSKSLWKDERAYLPNPHFDSTEVMDWSNTRSSFKTLNVPREKILVMPHSIVGFVKFFDDVGAQMLKLVETLSV